MIFHTLTAVLVVLKLLNLITIGWLWVLAPSILAVTLAVLLWAIALAALAWANR